MPLDLETAQDLPEGERGALPQAPPASPAPSVLDVAAAAERTSNLGSMIYQSFADPRPNAPAVSGYDPLSDVPKGLEPYANRFIDAQSPQEVQWIGGRIRDELQDKETIRRAGGWGTAATIAAGATDPLTLASMALFPEANASRMANALRWAAMNAGTTAVQEAATASFSETHTARDAAINIGAGALLGGILGGISRAVPARELADLRNNLAAELQPNGGDQVLGPTVRTIEDEGYRPPSAADMRSVPTYVPPAPEGPIKPSPGKIPDIDPSRMSLLEAAAVTKGASAETHGISWNEGLAQGLDPADMKGARFGARPVFTRGGASFDEMAEQLAQHGYPVADEAGNYSPNALLDSLDKELHGNKQYSPAADAYLAALEEHTQASQYAAQRAQRSPLVEWDLEREHDAAAIEAQREAEAYANPEESSTMGAAAVTRTDLKGNTIAGVGKTIAEGPIGRVAPGLRTLTSPSNEARTLTQQLVETREILNKNMQGIATAPAIETALRRQEGVWWQGYQARRDAFKAYLTRARAAGEATLSRGDFNREIAYAMRRGDQHAIPEVTQAAQDTRRIVFEPLYQRALKLGLIPQDAKLYADSYLMRKYDARKIRGNLSRWIDTLTEGFVAQGVDRAEARDIAYKAHRNVMGSERGLMDWNVREEGPQGSGRFEQRTLKLPDAVLEHFLSSDIDDLTHSYLHSMAPEVEMTERFGSRDLRDQLDAIRDEYSRLMERARVAGDVTEMNRLDKRRNADIRDLAAMRDRLYGIYGHPKDPGMFAVRAGRLLRSDNAARLLGVAMLAHIPDFANVITRYGLPNTFAALAKLGTSMRAIQMTRQEARRMGVGLDMVLNTSAALLGDYGSHSAYLEQRLASRFMRGFTIASGETPLITIIQSLASTVGSDELLRNAARAASGRLLPQRVMTRLAAAGIDRDMLARIAKEAGQHGEEVNGLRFGMSDRWADQGAAQAFESAILKDAHAMTLSPGAGDSPLRMSTEWGKAILQFKSFAFAASRHVLMPIAQGVTTGDMRAVTGLFSLLTAGYMTYVAKQTVAGQPIESNPGRLAAEVLDKTNLLGWTGELIYPALWQLGLKDFSRWSDRDPIETLGGPTAGTVGSLYSRRLAAKLFGNPEDGDKLFTRADLHFIRRLVPGQNLWYTRRAMNTLEDSVGDLFNLPGETQEQRQLIAANQ